MPTFQQTKTMQFSNSIDQQNLFTSIFKSSLSFNTSEANLYGKYLLSDFPTNTVYRAMFAKTQNNHHGSFAGLRHMVHICHAGWQVALWDIKDDSHSNVNSVVFCVPRRYVPSSTADFVPCDQVVQRGHQRERAYTFDICSCTGSPSSL